MKCAIKLTVLALIGAVASTKAYDLRGAVVVR